MKPTFFALPLLALAACASAATMEADTPIGIGQASAGMQMGTPMVWSGALRGQPGYEQTTGTAQASSSAEGAAISVSFAGTPMAGMTHTHPWHIHAGTCGSGGPIVGDPSAYTPLQPGEDGRGTASATIQPTLEMGQSYYVNVHASPSEMGTIIACADLEHAM